MADVLSKAKRSALMAKIRGEGNASTEQRLARLFRANHITGWRRGVPLPGKPDFVFRAEKVAVFVDGCFWHGCPKHARIPKTRVVFWSTKLEGNAARDSKVSRELRARGWTVLRVWECSLTVARGAATADRIARALVQKQHPHSG